MATVLICADNSKHSDHALEFYLNHIHKPGSRVKVVHCPENWEGIGPMEGPTPGRLHELQNEAKVNTAAIREKSVHAFSSHRVDGEFVELHGKEPWSAICKEAEKCNASLIVIGTRGQGTLRRTLLGSVSDSVLHHACCPVLVCRHKDERHHHHHH